MFSNLNEKKRVNERCGGHNRSYLRRFQTALNFLADGLLVWPTVMLNILERRRLPTTTPASEASSSLSTSPILELIDAVDEPVVEGGKMTTP